MIINCECGKKKFNIDSSLIPNEGRLLKCGSCSKIWHYTPIIETKNDEDLDVKINDFNPNKSHKIITYLSKYFSIAIPDPKMIKEAKNNLGSISFGYFTITPIGIEKIPSS